MGSKKTKDAHDNPISKVDDAATTRAMADTALNAIGTALAEADDHMRHVEWAVEATDAGADELLDVSQHLRGGQKVDSGDTFADYVTIVRDGIGTAQVELENADGALRDLGDDYGALHNAITAVQHEVAGRLLTDDPIDVLAYVVRALRMVTRQDERWQLELERG